MQQDSFFIRHTRIITIISIIGIAFCVSLIIIVTLIKEFSKKTFLTLQFAPASAKLEIIELELSLGNGTYELSPGTYTGILKANGFEPKKITINLEPRKTNNYTDYLVNSSIGLSYFERSASDISTLQQIKNETGDTTNPELLTFLEAYDHKTSIYDLLPLTISWFKHPNGTSIYNLTIKDGTYHPKCTSTLCLSTIGPKEDIAELEKALAERGYNINDYEVFYEYSAI